MKTTQTGIGMVALVILGLAALMFMSQRSPTPPPTPTAETFTYATIEEAIGVMGEGWPHISTPPEGYTLADALALPDRGLTVFTYTSGWYILQLNVEEGGWFPVNTPPEAPLETIRLGKGLSGTYFTGTWDFPEVSIVGAGNEGPTNPIDAEWNADDPSQTLIWGDDTHAFYLTAFYERPPEAPTSGAGGHPLSREAFIGLAQQLTP